MRKCHCYKCRGAPPPDDPRYPGSRTHPLTDPPDRDLDPPEPSDEELRQEKLRREWEEMQEEKEDSDA